MELTFKEFILHEQQLNELQDEQEMREVENHLSQMFSDIGVKRVVFTGHGGRDRVLGRNSDVSAQELSELFFKFKKMHTPKIHAEIEKRGQFQAVIKDYKSNLNVVIDYTISDGELRIVTLERKKPNEFKLVAQNVDHEKKNPHYASDNCDPSAIINSVYRDPTSDRQYGANNHK